MAKGEEQVLSDNGETSAIFGYRSPPHRKVRFL